MRALPGPGSRVAFYSRYSTSLQSYKSIEGQERLCAAYAEKQGWVETGRYSDAERSGTTTMGRQGLFQMLAAADRGKFQVLLLEDTDRASRDAADMHRIAKELEELDIVLCTVVGGVVTDIELAFKSVQHQQFIKQNAEKSKRGQELAVSQGRMSGSVAYGYRKVVAADALGNPINGLREKDPDRAAMVERIHQDFDAGKTTFEICKALNAEGEPAPTGGLWRVGTLLGNRHGGIGILRNPAYVGEYHYRKIQRKRRKNKMKMRFTAESERIIVQHPELRIIPQELWDRNQARLAENHDKPFHAKRKGEFVFTGRVFCGKCGCTSIASDGKYVCTGRSQIGVCDNTRRAPRIAVEQSVFDRLQKHLLSAGLLKPCIDAYREEAERARLEYEARRQGDQSRLKDVDQRIANLVAQLGGMRDTGYASQMLAVELDRLGAEKAILEKQSKVRHVAAVPVENAEIIADRITATLQNLQAALQGDDRETARARELLRGLVSRVVLTPTPGTPTDGRGAGDVAVTVEGPLAARRCSALHRRRSGLRRRLCDPRRLRTAESPTCRHRRSGYLPRRRTWSSRWRARCGVHSGTELTTDRAVYSQPPGARRRECASASSSRAVCGRAALQRRPHRRRWRYSASAPSPRSGCRVVAAIRRAGVLGVSISAFFVLPEQGENAPQSLRSGRHPRS